MKNHITLLDGSIHDEKKILEQMNDDAFYYGELSTKALSSSAAKLLINSPKQYAYVTKYGQKETQALRDGKLLHMFLLEPEKWEALNFVDVKVKRGKAWDEAVAEFGEVYTTKEKSDAERLAQAVIRNNKAMAYFKNAQFEIPKIGYIGSEGNEVPFRAKADIITQSGGIADIKTTTNLKGFKYSARDYCYAAQAYIYCTLWDIPYYDWTYIVVDKGSLDIGIVPISEEFLQIGKEQTELAIERYITWIADPNADLNDYYITFTL